MELSLAAYTWKFTNSYRMDSNEQCTDVSCIWSEPSNNVAWDKPLSTNIYANKDNSVGQGETATFKVFRLFERCDANIYPIINRKRDNNSSRNSKACIFYTISTGYGQGRDNETTVTIRT
jgi:hypothetical protein